MVEEILKAGAGVQEPAAVEFQVPVTAAESPQPSGLGVVQAGGWEPRPRSSEVLLPGWQGIPGSSDALGQCRIRCGSRRATGRGPRGRTSVARALSVTVFSTLIFRPLIADSSGVAGDGVGVDRRTLFGEVADRLFDFAVCVLGSLLGVAAQPITGDVGCDH